MVCHNSVSHNICLLFGYLFKHPEDIKKRGLQVLLFGHSSLIARFTPVVLAGIVDNAFLYFGADSATALSTLHHFAELKNMPLVVRNFFPGEYKLNFIKQLFGNQRLM